MGSVYSVTVTPKRKDDSKSFTELEPARSYFDSYKKRRPSTVVTLSEDIFEGGKLQKSVVLDTK